MSMSDIAIRVESLSKLYHIGALQQRHDTLRDALTSRFRRSHHSTNSQSTNSRSTDIVCNADMRVGEIRQFCKLQDEGQSLMRAAMSQMNLSARAYHRILKLARTIADLAGSEEIQSAHLAEALHATQSSEVDDGNGVMGRLSPHK